MGGVIVGSGDITKAIASARKTRIMNVTIEVRSAGVLLDGASLSNGLKLK